MKDLNKLWEGSVDMHNGFTKGMIVGGIIAASVSMMANSDMMRPGNRRKMMRAGKTFLRKSGSIMGSVAEILR